MEKLCSFIYFLELYHLSEAMLIYEAILFYEAMPFYEAISALLPVVYIVHTSISVLLPAV